MIGLLRETELRRFTVEEYSRLGEIGVISPDERVELIDGMICKMGPEGIRHVAAIDLALNLFNSRLKGLHGIRIQHPLRVASHAEPEPDIAIVEEADPRAYLDGHPTTALLVIEVADNSLEKDLTSKALTYAKAGIPEYWVVNLIQDNVELFRDPSLDGYLQRKTVSRGQAITPASLSNIEIPVDDLIP